MIESLIACPGVGTPQCDFTECVCDGVETENDYSELVSRVRVLQRSTRQGRLQWHYYCDNFADGIRDPVRYPACFLSNFFHALREGLIPENLDDPFPAKQKKIVQPVDLCTPESLISRDTSNLFELQHVANDEGLFECDFTLLALFDGIRGCSAALRSLGLLPRYDYSSEIDENCQRINSRNFPRCKQLGDVRKIQKETLEQIVEDNKTCRRWLVVGGSPCQDLSCRRGKNSKGLVGRKSKLFYEYVRVINTLLQLGAQVAFILENVASMPDSERDMISEALGVQPLAIDAVILSPCHRDRYYWTNLPAIEPQSRQEAIDIDSFLDDGWQRDPPGRPFRCLVASAAFQTSRGRAEFGVVRKSDGVERPLNAEERESILGFPRGHTRLLDDAGTDLISERLRWKMLGNSFSVQVVAHLLEPLAAWEKQKKQWDLRPLCEDSLVLNMNRVREQEGELSIEF